MYVPDLEILHTNTVLLKPGVVLIYFSSRYDLLRKTGGENKTEERTGKVKSKGKILSVCCFS